MYNLLGIYHIIFINSTYKTYIKLHSDTCHKSVVDSENLQKGQDTTAPFDVGLCGLANESGAGYVQSLT